MNKKNIGQSEEFDEENRLIINITLKNDEGFLSPFSYGDHPQLGAEAAEFLSKSVRPKYLKSELHVKINSDVIDDGEKVIYEKAIREHFEREYLSDKHKIRRDTFAAMIMLLAGIVFLTAMIIFDYLEIGSIALEIIDIVAWVFLWESADLFFLQRHVSRWMQHKNIGFVNAKISFGGLNSK